MRLRLLLSALFISFLTFSQSPAELKEFINKTNLAIRNVQKNIVAKGVSDYDQQFRDILKLQLSAVKLYATDTKLSFALANLARKECLNFLKKHTLGSLDYFELSDKEKSFSQEKVTGRNMLTEQELKQISEINISDFKSLNELPLTIQ